MNTDWVEVRLGDLGRVVTGKTPPTSEHKYFNGNYNFISPKDMGFDSRYITSTLTTVTKEAISKFKNQVLPKNAIMYTALSYGFGKMGIANDICLTNQQINSIIVDEVNYDFSFVYYLLRNSKDYFLTFNAGIVTPIVPKSTFQKIKLSVPKQKSTQQKIAQILSAYDDLIENNLKRIKLLEEMAQQTYEEWFVRMKFPNHKTTPIDAETGLPEGWEEINLGNACIVSGGGTPSKGKAEYWENGSISWFTPTDLSKANSLILLDSISKTTEKGLLKSSAKLMQANSFMMSSRATIGLFGLTDKPFSTNQGFINITPFEEEHKLFLLFNFKSRVQEFYNNASGATFPEISKTNFKRLKIKWPTNKIFQTWNNKVTPIIGTMSNLTKQNQYLKEARDILLPRLMTGMIDVDKIKIPSLKTTPSEPENA